ncbi:MAG: FAD-dependent oxidoreductase [Acidimicrobiales bacterium]|nr:FAD-dependent oxidoreductase [Acidimicrobiales bacterium]
MDHRDRSLWLATVPGSLEPRPPLDRDLDVDLAVVGGGYTGLWTALELLKAEPSVRVALVEKEICGFGASGRNGGWCSALFAPELGALARRHGREAALALHRAMTATVDEVGRAAAEEGIDCHFAKGGTVTLVTAPSQLARVRASVTEARELGVPHDDLRWLDAPEARREVAADGVLGAAVTPHCAAIHPARLARGLADAVARRGGQVFEATPALAIEPRSVRTPGGTLRADVVVRATEGYTTTLPGFRRVLAPLYSLMIATEPLPDAFWDHAGLARRQTFSDGRHLLIYGQRTADGRFAFGGRGAPYHFGSRIDPRFDREPLVFAALHRTLLGLFPGLDGVRITHQWGGPLGVPRDWHSSVGLDRATGTAWGGGYVGDGVGTANLAGRTLADLILERDTELVRLPWVNHRSPRWEPEPLRWLGISLGLWLSAAADREESRTGRAAGWRSQLIDRVTGH